MILDPNTLRSELEAVRGSTPLRPGAKRRKVVFPESLREKVCQFARASGLLPDRVAELVGLSGSVLRKWLAEAKPARAFIPVQVQDSQETSYEPQNASAMVVSVRTVSLSVPGDLEPAKLGQMIAAMFQGGETC